jgi:hypothetical protein
MSVQSRPPLYSTTDSKALQHASHRKVLNELLRTPFLRTSGKLFRTLA